jgi:uncharacterized coiled-coil DUF342 family protein
MRIITTSTGVALALAVAGCGGKGPTQEGAGQSATNAPAEAVTLEDVREETAEAVGAAVALADQTQDEYVDQVKSEITEVGQRLDALRAKAKALGEQARATWNDRVAELAKKQQALQDSLTDVADSTGDAWQELAQGMSQARKDMADALQKAEAEFNEQQPADEPKQASSGEE